LIYSQHILESGERTVPRKQRKPGVWDDLDRRLDATDRIAREFFSDTQAVTVEHTPFSQLELSDEELSEPLVSVRFDADGIAEQISDEEAEPADLLEPMPIPAKLGATEWGSTFAEVHARVQEMYNVSKPSAIRYVVRGVGQKVSSLPSAIDYCADVCVVARRVLTPSLYRVWREIWLDGYGKDADRVPEGVQSTIMQLCCDAWKKAGLLPFRSYWARRVDLERMRVETVKNVVDARDARNAVRRINRARRAAQKRAAKLQAAA
jgi:hypothetical protein